MTMYVKHIKFYYLIRLQGQLPRKFLIKNNQDDTPLITTDVNSLCSTL